MSYQSKRRRYKEVLEAGSGLIDFYLQNPCIAAYDLVGVDLAPIQRIVFEDFWFKNYVMAIAGRGFGKSVYTNSLSFMENKGLIYLNEELPPIPLHLKDGEEEIISSAKKIYTSEGFKNTKRLCLEKGIEGKQLTTKKGFVNRGSNHHPLLTLDSECNFVYKSMDEFKPGDRICIQRGQMVFGKNEIPLDDAYLIGLFIANGSRYIGIVNKRIRKFCMQYCRRHKLKHKKDGVRSLLKVFFRNFNYFFEKYKLDIQSGLVPYLIRTATKESQIAFLQGYYDVNGTFNDWTGGFFWRSSSKRSLQEIQLMLLNFGIISMLKRAALGVKTDKIYLLHIVSEDAYKFNELIGSGLELRQKTATDYFNEIPFESTRDTIPHILQMANEVVTYCHDAYKTRHKPSFKANKCGSEFTYEKLHTFLAGCRGMEYAGFSLIKRMSEINKLYNILDQHYYFDTVESVHNWKGDCYDFEMDMDGEPNYFVNGFINHNTFLLGLLAALGCMLIPGMRVGLISPVFRQSKMIFAEVEKLYAQSSILREACDKPPTRGSDVCYLRFKSAGGKTPSYIEALPLGADGSKIRGSRFYLLLIDEFAQVPDKIISSVLLPMGSTSLAPMERVRRFEQKERLIKLGLALETDFEDESVNKMITTSSAFYKFNHMWRRMKDHWIQDDLAKKEGVQSKYAVWQVPHWDLPEGFLDVNNVAEAKRTMSNAEFRMEYEAEMVSDSEGFFKASLLEECSINSGFTIELRGDPRAQYIVGVDPNQGGRASCGVVVLRIGLVNKIVRVLELRTQTTQQLTQLIQDLCEKLNVIRVFIDKGGGGKAVCDLLEEGYGGKQPLIDRTNDDHRHLPGAHILELTYFNPAWIADANFTTKAMLEDKKLLFPEPPIGSTLDIEAASYDTINTLKSQMLNIIVTQTATGILHFDTPQKDQNKDLYSALLLAAHGAKMVEKELEGDGEPILFNSSGLIRMHGGQGTTFDQVSAKSGGPVGASIVSAAVLKKKFK